MARMGRCDFKELVEFQKKVENLKQKQIDDFMDSCAKELAARLLRKVIKRTPVGEYPSSTGKQGGTLRKGWSAQKDIKVHRFGNNYVVEIVNPVEYASYVEYGHRKRGGKGWVPGKFMLTISEQEIRASSDKILEKKLKTFLEGVFNDK